MDKRRLFILNTIIKEHIKSGLPVGSSSLVNKYKLDVSPATVRNEMANLEEEGYIRQPYTSAGRIPTEKAYRLYVENLKEKKLNEKELNLLNTALAEKDEANFKQVAKIMANISDIAVFWAFHRNNLFYTGISNLFQQPEFSSVINAGNRQSGLIYDFSSVIDRMDEIIDEIFYNISDDTEIMIGSENPFGNFCGTILTKYKIDNNEGLFGVLGPIRMDYEKNVFLVNYIRSTINH